MNIDTSILINRLNDSTHLYKIKSSLIIKNINEKIHLGYVYEDIYHSMDNMLVFSPQKNVLKYYNLNNLESDRINIYGELISAVCNEKYIVYQYMKKNKYYISTYFIDKNKTIDTVITRYKNSVTLQDKYINIRCPHYLGKVLIYDIAKEEIEEFIEEKSYFISKSYNSVISYDIDENNTFIFIDDKVTSLKGRLKEHFRVKKHLYILVESDYKHLLYSIDIASSEVHLIFEFNFNISDFWISNGYFIYHKNDIIFGTYKYKSLILNENKSQKINEDPSHQRFKYSHNTSNITKCKYDIYEQLGEKRTDKVYIYIHGGPHNNVGREYDNIKDYLLSFGHKLIVINYHGSTGFGIKYERSIYGQWGILELEDIKNIYKEHMNNDIRIIGISYGAILSLLSVFKVGLQFKKCLSISPSINIDEFYQNLSQFHKNIFKRRILYSENTFYDTNEMSLINYFKDSNTHTSLLYGELDSKIGLNSLNGLLNKNFNNLQVVKVRNSNHDLGQILDNIEDKSVIYRFFV